jgi:hypothetical protein
MNKHLFLAIVLAVVELVAMPARAAAQFAPITPIPLDDVPELEPVTYPPTVATVSAGPFLPVAAWDQTLPPAVRFVILTNFQNDAVLDRETGLVWARQAAQVHGDREFREGFGPTTCFALKIGNRRGWRLPTGAELMTLLDPSRPFVPGSPRFPEGHPFRLLPLISGPLLFWASDLFRNDSNDVQTRLWVAEISSGNLAPPVFLTAQVLCVRDQP